MALRARLTKSLLANHHQAMLAAGETLWLVWDSEIAGFGARLVKKGIVFFLNYRHGRTERRMTLGTIGELRTVEAARKKAAELKLAVRSGGDPLQEIRDKRTTAVGGVTLAAVIEDWQADNTTRWSAVTARSYREIMAKNVLPQLGDREIESITRLEWSHLISGVKKRSPSVASQLRRILGSLLGWAVHEQLLSAVNLPSASRSAPKAEARDRVVTDDEIKAIWTASGALEPRARAFARYVVLTVVRSGAAVLTRREWLQDRAVVYPGDTRGLKRQAGRRGQAHRAALSEWALEQIAPAIEAKGGDLLFSARKTPIHVGSVLDTLRKATGIPDWEFHDLRRSARSWMAANGISRDAAETVLGHVIHTSEVDRAYQRYGFEREAEIAFHSWQRHVQEIVEGTSSTNVVALRAKE